jgi:hypothetical protein
MPFQWLNLFPLVVDIICADGLNFWRDSASEINNQLYEGLEINTIVSGTYIILFRHT